MRHFNSIILLAMIMLLSASQISYSQETGTPTTSVGHSEAVSSIAVSPNGRLLLSGSWDKTVKLWDIRSRRLLRTMKGHTKKVNCIAFSPDGKTAASAAGYYESSDATIVIWNLIDGSELAVLRGHNACVNSIAFSPDGKYLISGGGFFAGFYGAGGESGYPYDGRLDKVVRLWDVSTGKLLRTYEGHEFSITYVTFTPDGNSILSGGGGRRDHSIKIWDTNSGALLRQFNGHSDRIEVIAISPDGGKVVSGQSLLNQKDRTKNLAFIAWDLNNCISVRKLGKIEVDDFDYCNCSTHIEKRYKELYLSLPCSAAFSPNGKYLAIGHHEGIFCVLETENYTPYQIYGANKVISGEPSGIEHDIKSHVFSIAFSSDSEFIISGHIDSQIKLWDRKTGKLIDTFPSQLSEVSAAEKTNENAYEVIYYPQTGLEWCAGTNHDIYWEQANEWVSSLKFKGGNWRMPTEEELRNLNEYENNAYPNKLVKAPCVWSSDTRGNGAQKQAYAFNFYLPRLSGFYPPDRRSGCCALAVRKRTRFAPVLTGHLESENKL